MKKIYLLSLFLSFTAINIFAQTPVITLEPDGNGDLQVCEGADITISITATNATSYQ